MPVFLMNLPSSYNETSVYIELVSATTIYTFKYVK